MGFWFTGTALLLMQDEDVNLSKTVSYGRRTLKVAPIGRRQMTRAVLRYLTPGFHPLRNPNSRLAEDTLEELAGKYGIPA
jgi:hypothetical protein